MGKIKVSVIMTVYNAENYLRQALDSVINQTLKEIEIILVDDLSTDGSYNILHEYVELDARVKVLQHKEKTDGAAAARNMGMDAACGEYLSFLDADDYFELTMLEQVYERAVLTDADVVIFDGYKYREATGCDEECDYLLNKELLPNKKVFSPATCGARLFRMQFGAAWNNLFRTDFVRNNGLRFFSMHFTDDQVFVYLAYALSRRIAILPERLIHWRKDHSASQSSHAGEHPEAVYMAPLTLKKELERNGIYDRYWQAVANLSISLGVSLMSRAVSYEVFEEECEGLHKSLRELQADKLLPEHMIYPNFCKWRDLILSGSARDVIDEWYLPKMMDKEPANLLAGVPWGERLVIYGAGDRGKQVFKALLGFPWSNVVNWVDREYARLGFPVNNPESLRNGGFDSIIIAVESFDIYRKIVSYLQSMGIKRKNIIWLFRNM